MFDPRGAACADMPTELFFPHGDATGKQVREAKKVCGGCPIAVQCLTWAIENNEHGIWGGTTVNQRKELRRSPKRRQLLIQSMLEERDR
jgi:WhiB family transcriptional regulator, redox-sensing transcriptional regulator